MVAGDAADTVLRDWESFVSFYDFPVEHWVHLRTTNPLESVFSAVRLRTDATRRMKRRDSALYLVFKVSLRLSERWRPLNGGRNLMGLLIDGAVRAVSWPSSRTVSWPRYLPVSAQRICRQSPLDELNHLEAISTTAMIPYGPSGTGAPTPDSSLASHCAAVSVEGSHPDQRGDLPVAQGAQLRQVG